LWLALRHLGPSFFAFVLSFAIILITWVNHHGFLKLVNKSSGAARGNQRRVGSQKNRRSDE
jgi:uncharacterized membrane protein